MNKNKKHKIYLIKFIIYILSVVLLYIILNKIPLFNSYNIYIKILYLFLLEVVLSFIIDNLLSNKISNIYMLFSFFSYMIILFITLYVRKQSSENIIEDPNYIKDWIYILFSNYTVFINIVCNVILFIPLGIYISYIKLVDIYKLIIVIIFISINEYIQFIFKRGVFDFIDICLNLIGTILGYILFKVIKGEKHEGRQKQKT